MPNAPVFARVNSNKLRNYKAPAKLTKRMTAIAKKVVHGTAETKSPINTYGFNQTDDVVYASNVNYFLTQGTSSTDLIGEKFYLKNIYARFELYDFNSATASQETLAFRIMLVRTKKALTNTSAAITASDVFRGSNFHYASQGFVDLHKVDIIMDKLVYFDQPNQTSWNINKSFQKNIKINKTLFFDSDNSGYLKDKNYYFITTAHKSTPNANTTSYFRVQYAMNYTDM